jgi:hypothetical protein
VEILYDIRDWIQNQSHPIFWLHGVAGIGKSTIAQTIAENCDRDGYLGASFFFSRDIAECSNPLLVFTSIAYQLALLPRFRSQILSSLQANPHAMRANLRTQFLQLIVQPLRSVESPTNIVVVMDALDECGEEQLVSQMLQILISEISRIPFLKFFITSRPEPYINMTLNSPSLQTIVLRNNLHETEWLNVDEDIKLFLCRQLREISEKSGHKRWPTDSQLDNLVEKAAGSFLVASTAIKFIQDPNFRDPRGRLDALLEGRDGSSFANLSHLYLQILRKAVPETASQSLTERFRTIVGTICWRKRAGSNLRTLNPYLVTYLFILCLCSFLHAIITYEFPEY